VSGRAGSTKILVDLGALGILVDPRKSEGIWLGRNLVGIPIELFVFGSVGIVSGRPGLVERLSALG